MPGSRLCLDSEGTAPAPLSTGVRRHRDRRMRITRIALLALIGFLSTSCTMSVHSLFNDGERSSEPALVGVWESKEQKATLTLQWLADGRLYSLHTAVEDQPAGSAEFDVVLGRVGEHRFLEVHPRSNTGGLYSFWKVDLDGDSLTLTPLNPHWIESMDKAGMRVIEHEPAFGGITLTASTKELKTFVLKYVDNKAAFSDELKFQRKK